VREPERDSNFTVPRKRSASIRLPDGLDACASFCRTDKHSRKWSNVSTEPDTTRRVLHRLAVGVLAAGALTAAGCGIVPHGSATSGSPTADSSTSGTDDDTRSAPSVSRPLDPARLASDPCSALTSAQRSTLGLEDGRSRSNEAGSACAWIYRDDDTRSSRVDVALDPNSAGLAGIYKLYAEGGTARYEYWEPTDVSGYPAVYAATKDFRTKGQCKLLVGVTDTRAVQVFTQIGKGPGATGPCPYALKTAQAVIATLQQD
jgi:hypothetical protein